MIDSLVIAWKYLRFNKAKAATIVACVSLIAVLPLALQQLLGESERQLLSRAVTTPLVIGAKGSSLDLVMNSIYFGDEVPELIDMGGAEEIWDSGLATAIPLYVRFKARGYPIVGTSLDYFDFRGLKVSRGRPIAVLGDCVVGAAAAEKLGLNPGDSLISAPETLFDLAGIYPLKMRVAGVLEPTHSADDQAIFVDLKTAWVIQGLGHGHEDVTKTKDPTVILRKTDGNVAANAKLLHYMEITEKNIGDFHFHGDLSGYPVSAVVAVPHDAKSGTILRGRYLEREERYQIVRPEEVVDSLLQNIFRIKNVLDAVILLVGFATLLAVVLVFALSLRLRQRELQTIFKIGCRRMTIVRLLGAEVFIIAALSGLLCLAVMVGVDRSAESLVRMLFIR
jgi:putative ABC transport system permease protein